LHLFCPPAVASSGRTSIASRLSPWLSSFTRWFVPAKRWATR
jgi:hypothetical protein